MPVPQQTAVINTPIGRLKLMAENDVLISIDFHTEAPLCQPVVPILKTAVQQLTAYFDDASFRFDLPWRAQGTPFQQRVWSAMAKIPVGETRTYQTLAQQLKTAPRAIGGACRSNPLPLILPCHRIVAKYDLGGFSGERTERWLGIKKWLLKHECAPIAGG